MAVFVPEIFGLYNRSTMHPPNIKPQASGAASELDTTPELLVRRPRVRRRPGELPTHLSLPRQVAVVAIWPLLEQLMASLVNWVDTGLAGHLSVESVESTNAISVGGFIVWMMGLCQGAVGVGSTALIARAVGARHRREAHAAVGQSMLLAVACGIVVGVIFFIAAPFAGHAFGLTGRTLDLCTMYLRLLAIAAPPMSVLFIGAACLRGAGDFRSAVVIMLIVNLVNVTMTFSLVAAGLGLKGIAIGTVAAWFVGGTVMVLRLAARGSGAVLHIHRLRWQPRTVRRLVRLGIPSLMENVLYWAGHGCVMGIIGRLGDMNLIGAHQIGIRIESLSFLPGYALGLAAATMAGQYLGARNPALAARAIWTCWAYAAAIMGVVGVLFMVIPGPFVSLMTDKPQFTGVLPRLLFMAGWCQVGLATSMVLSGALRGAGDVRAAMTLMLGSIWLVRVPAVYIAAIHFHATLVTIWAVTSAELVLRGAVFLARFLHGGWKTVKV